MARIRMKRTGKWIGSGELKIKRGGSQWTMTGALGESGPQPASFLPSQE